LILSIGTELCQDRLLRKTYRLKTLSFLALGWHELPDFAEAVGRADDRSGVLFSWVALHPPSDPGRITELTTGRAF
jgi:hypothetical protein